MKKKLIPLLLTGTLLLSMAACGTNEETNTDATSPSPTKEAIATTVPTSVPAETPASTPTEAPAPAAKTISPLPVTIDINNLTDCTVAVSFETGDAYVDDTGKMQLKVKVYTYDLYDMIDLAMLAPGDTIILKDEAVLITDLVRTEQGAVQINGGLDMGGYELISTDTTVYFETGYSDVKSYYELGEVTLPVSADFIFTDKSDPEGTDKSYYAGDFLTDEAGIDYFFTPHNTRIVIEGGVVTQMERVYTP